MSGILFGIAVFVSAYIADLLASHWGFNGNTRAATAPQRQRATKRITSSRLKGHASSASPARRTGIRSP